MMRGTAWKTLERHPQTTLHVQKAPDLSGAFLWCARGDSNPHALSDTGT